MKTTIILGTLLALLTTGALADCPRDTRGAIDCGVRSGEAVIGTIAITGRVRGPFPGGPFTVLGFTHEIVSPRDAASGLPTGKRQHKPLVVRIPVGTAAPLIVNAIAANESLPTVTLNLYRPGTTTVVTRITLTNASVAAFSNQCDRDYAGCESIALTYQRIEWTSVESGNTAVDDWESPVV